MKKDILLQKVDRNGLIIISVGVALVYWRFDSLHPGEILTRLFTVTLFIVYGIFTQYLINEYKCMTAALKKAHNELMNRVVERTAGWVLDNEGLHWLGQKRKPGE